MRSDLTGESVWAIYKEPMCIFIRAYLERSLLLYMHFSLGMRYFYSSDAGQSENEAYQKILGYK